MLTFGQLLAKIINAIRAGRKHEPFSRDTKFPCTTLYGLGRGEHKTIKVEQIQQLAAGFGCSFMIIVGPRDNEYFISTISHADRQELMQRRAAPGDKPYFREQNPFSPIPE